MNTRRKHHILMLDPHEEILRTEFYEATMEVKLAYTDTL